MPEASAAKSHGIQLNSTNRSSFTFNVSYQRQTFNEIAAGLRRGLIQEAKTYQAERRRSVVRPSKPLNFAIEHSNAVLSFRAQIPDAVLEWMPCIQKRSNVGCSIAVQGFYPARRIPHRKHPVRDVRQIQIHSVSNEAQFFLRHKSFDSHPTTAHAQVLLRKRCGQLLYFVVCCIIPTKPSHIGIEVAVSHNCAQSQQCTNKFGLLLNMLAAFTNCKCNAL
jgi:hypothetical protein